MKRLIVFWLLYPVMINVSLTRNHVTVEWPLVTGYVKLYITFLPKIDTHWATMTSWTLLTSAKSYPTKGYYDEIEVLHNVTLSLRNTNLRVLFDNSVTRSYCVICLLLEHELSGDPFFHWLVTLLSKLCLHANKWRGILPAVSLTEERVLIYMSSIS